MKPEIVKDILEIIKDQSLDEILSENDGLRKRYCDKIFKRNVNFFIRTINNNLYEYLKKVYILKEKTTEYEFLKEEEIELIKKYIIFNKLKTLDKNTLEKLQIANDVSNKHMDKKIENNKDFRIKIMKFIKENDGDFYNNYIRRTKNLNDERTQINMVKEYNEYLKNKS